MADGAGASGSIIGAASGRRLDLLALPGTTPLCVVEQPGLALLPGTDGPDTLTGTGGPDRMEGLGGDDHLRGARARDIVNGGAGGAGADTLDGGSGADRIDGGPDNDIGHDCERISR